MGNTKYFNKMSVIKLSNGIMNLIYITMCIFLIQLTSCNSKRFYTNNNTINYNYNFNSPLLDSAFSEAQGEILFFLERHKFDTKAFKYIYIIDKFKEPGLCPLITDTTPISYINLQNKLLVGSNFASALILDSDNNYTAKSSTHTLFRNPQNANYYYQLEKKLIELFVKESYLGFIRVNCSVPVIIGFNNSIIDIYERKDNTVIKRSSIKLK